MVSMRKKSKGKAKAKGVIENPKPVRKKAKQPSPSQLEVPDSQSQSVFRLPPPPRMFVADSQGEESDEEVEGQTTPTPGRRGGRVRGFKYDKVLESQTMTTTFTQTVYGPRSVSLSLP